MLCVGREMMPYPEHGVNAIDCAVMREVRAVDRLDKAALGAAGVLTLSEEIELALRAADDRVPALSAIPAGRAEPDQKTYTTAQAAAFFGRSARWLQRGVRDGRFTYTNGTRIEPIRQERRCLFTIPLLRSMASQPAGRGASPRSNSMRSWPGCRLRHDLLIHRARGARAIQPEGDRLWTQSVVHWVSASSDEWPVGR